MSLDEGDVVRFDYVLWVQGDDKPLETSMEEVAKEHDLHNPQKHYRPMAATIGGRNLLPALEAVVRDKAKAGKELSVELAAGEAYGQRDAHNIKDIPMAQFRKQKVDPKVGMVLNFEDRRAVVTRVAGGRVRLDLNHDLAGKDLRYDLVIREILTDDAAKLEAVLGDLFPMGGHKVRLEGDVVDLEVPDQVKFDQQWPMMKFQVITQIRQVLGLDKTIRIIESYPAMKPDAAPGSGQGEEE